MRGRARVQSRSSMIYLQYGSLPDVHLLGVMLVCLHSVCLWRNGRLMAETLPAATYAMPLEMRHSRLTRLGDGIKFSRTVIAQGLNGGRSVMRRRPRVQSWLCVGHCTAAGSSLARLVEGENVCLSVERKVSCFAFFRLQDEMEFKEN